MHVIQREGEGADVLGQRVRPFAPLAEDHWLARGDAECPGCHRGFAAGEVTCLLVMESEENTQAAAEAEERGAGAYNAVATPAHWTCVTGSTDPVGDFERHFGNAPAEPPGRSLSETEEKP